MRPGIVELLNLALLPLKDGIVHAPSVDTRRRTSFEPRDLEADACKLFRQVNGRGFAGAATRDLCVGPDVNPSTEKGSGRDDYCLAAESPAFERLYSENLLVVHDQ